MVPRVSRNARTAASRSSHHGSGGTSRSSTDKRLPVDVDERGDVVLASVADPDDRGDRASLDIESLPHAAGRPPLAAASHDLALVLLIATAGQGVHDVVGLHEPPSCVAAPRHPTVLLELAEGVHVASCAHDECVGTLRGDVFGVLSNTPTKETWTLVWFGGICQGKRFATTGAE